MDSTRWNKVQALFEAASELQSAERDKFLRNACAGDSNLYEEVQALLEADAKPHSLLDGFAGDAIDLPEVLSLEGKLIGAYRIVQQIGVGGMGNVYLAERADGQFEQKVALKLIKLGLNSEDILQRFQSERQILARLQHPNIAQLFDGGLTTEGRPFFTMEFVEGKTIDQYCDRHQLTVDERLELFQTVCATVQYAHRNLVVHRDLKPSNILITEDGTIKLLDFGIAKLLSAGDEAQSLATLTQIGQRVMTPEYASPEQIRGEAITTTSDVYSLGVILYELLSGQRPFQLTTRTPAEIEKLISATEPKKPSTAVNVSDKAETATTAAISLARRTQPEKLRRKLSGDLDNICLMALRKEPERRYHSVEQLLQDITCHLQGLPVAARPSTVSYRAQKFVQRHKLGVAMTAALVILISGLSGFYTWRLANERDRAQLEAQKAAQVSAFLVDLFKVSDPDLSKGETITARELLDQGAERVRKELSGQPEIQAAMMNVIGKVYHSLGLYENAASLLEQALKIRRNLYGNEHAEIAESMNNLGKTLEARGDYDEAERLHRASLTMQRKAFRKEPLQVAASLDNLAWVLYRKGAYDSAAVLYNEALVIRRGIFGAEHLDIATSLNNLAEILDEKADHDSAEALYRQALAMNRKFLGEEHREVATNMSNLANLLRLQGNLVEAESLHRRALAIRRKLLGDEHPHVTSSLNSLAVLLHEKGDYAAAEPLFREALALRRKMLGEEHPQVAVPLTGLAALLYDKDDLEGAETLFRQSLTLHRKTLPEGHLNIAHPLYWLGLVLSDKGRYHEAEPLLREAVQLRRQGLPKGQWRIALAENALGDCLRGLSRYEEAESLLLASYPILEAKYDKQSKPAIRAMTRIIKLYEAWDKPDKAGEYRAALAN